MLCIWFPWAPPALTLTEVKTRSGWGGCDEDNKCTGMIGMVSRNEVDFALGTKSTGRGICSDISPSCPAAHSAQPFLPVLIRKMVNSQKQSHPNTDIRPDAPPCKNLEKSALTSDILTGPFIPTPNRAKNVDFSTTISIEYNTIILPLSLKADVWSIVRPFEYEVWIATLAIIPIFILAVGLVDYISSGKINWERIGGFVTRIVLSQQVPKLPDDKLYKKILVIVWMWSFLVLVESYAGILTAMITREVSIYDVHNIV